MSAIIASQGRYKTKAGKLLNHALAMGRPARARGKRQQENKSEINTTPSNVDAESIVLNGLHSEFSIGSHRFTPRLY